MMNRELESFLLGKQIARDLNLYQTSLPIFRTTEISWRRLMLERAEGHITNMQWEMQRKCTDICYDISGSKFKTFKT